MGRTLLFFFLLVSALTRLNAQEKKAPTAISDSIRMDMPQVVIIGKKD